MNFPDEVLCRGASSLERAAGMIDGFYGSRRRRRRKRLRRLRGPALEGVGVVMAAMSIAAVALELPMVDGEDQRVFSLPLTGVVLTGTLELEGIRDLVLAGVVHRDALVSEFILPLITPLDPSALFDDLDGLFDVMTNPESATCDGFSVGLTATATALPAHLF